MSKYLASLFFAISLVGCEYGTVFEAWQAGVCIGKGCKGYAERKLNETTKKYPRTMTIVFQLPDIARRGRCTGLIVENRAIARKKRIEFDERDEYVTWRIPSAWVLKGHDYSIIGSFEYIRGKRVEHDLAHSWSGFRTAYRDTRQSGVARKIPRLSYACGVKRL